MAPDITISHYSTGTATVAANGTVVTGQGTAWAGAARTGDLFGTHRGLPIRILAVNSNTSLTLAHPWPGSAQTAASYEIQCTPRDVGYRRAIEELISDVSEGNLPLLAALLGAPNKLAYFDSSHSMALADFPAWARALFGLPGGADKLPYLSGASGAELADFPAWARALFAETGELPDGALPERLRASSPRLETSSDDLNDLSESGFYVTAGGVAENRPLGVGEWFVFNIADDLAGLGARAQIAVRRTTAAGGMAFRHRDVSGVWQDWKIVYHSQNLVGTVSQSGGIPTGAVIESGENANGKYTRFADGTQICQGTVSITPVANEVSTATATFPVEFFSPPTVVVSTVSNSIAVVRPAALNSQATTTSVTVNFIRSNTGVTMQNYEASGRWF
ncbi:MAG TPA: pyocin knob domain-containing protein [Pelagibacterium sp.]|uniref:pyocin knob domain-containing protein n=1 Tax=Pelagibacterium sp. TaxID=1967288 RepID=UPI002CA4FE20|nr:pyocin knob domain-containing protein [Pelagibacterium sp.]HWJ88502.1 pyocin knob domain-containing protein [Pelagibacterium sp.]